MLLLMTGHVFFSTRLKRLNPVIQNQSRCNFSGI